ASQPWKPMAVPAVCCHPHIAQPTVTPRSARRPTITNAVFMRGERSLSGSRSGFDVGAPHVRKGQEIIAHQRQRIAAVYLDFSPCISSIRSLPAFSNSASVWPRSALAVSFLGLGFSRRIGQQ